MTFIAPVGDTESVPKPRNTSLDRKSCNERAMYRFSLLGKRAIGKEPFKTFFLRDLSDSVPEVTGGAQGLGLACSKALLEHGVSHLIIFDIDEKGAEVVSQLESHNVEGSGSAKILFRKVNVTDQDELRRTVHSLAMEYGGIDILLCFAGTVNCEHAIDYEAANWRKIIDVNTTGSFLTAQAVAR